jgi:hypothetical protein
MAIRIDNMKFERSAAKRRANVVRDKNGAVLHVDFE